MNKIKLIVALLLLNIFPVISQNEFNKEWETKVSVPNKWNDQNADLSLILIGDLKELEMVNGTNGKSLWTFRIKEKLGVKQMEDWHFLWAYEGEPIEIVYKKPKEDSKTSVYLNPKTGEIESSVTYESLKKKKVKEHLADEAYDKSSNTTVSLIYTDKFFVKHSGSEFDVTVLASGGNSWSSTIKVKAASHLNRVMLSSSEPNVMMYVKIVGDKVLIIGEGMTALDLKTGKTLWNATFDYVQSGMTSQEIGHCPLPVFDKQAVYYCDFSKGEKAIKKLDINSGKLIWTGDNLSKNDVISAMEISNNILIVKFGGYIRKAKNIYNPNSGATTYKAVYDYEGDTDIRAYDVSDGKRLWTAENLPKEDKFSKSECSILTDGNNLIASSLKTFYIIESASGKVIGQSAIASNEIGKPQFIFAHEGNYIVEGEKGIASFDKAAKQNYAISTGKRLMSEFKGNAFIVWTGKDVDDMNEFIRFDLSSGKILGKLKGTYYPRFDSTGDYFIRFKDTQITKFKTN